MKGGSIRTLLVTVVLTLFAAPALAQQNTIASRMTDWLRFLLQEATTRSEDTFLLYIKIITFIILFAVLFWGTGRIFTEAQHRNIRLSISLCLSLLAVVGIPNELLRTLVVSYGVVAGALLALLPVYATYLISKGIGQETTGAHWLRVFLFILIAVLLIYFGEQLRTIDASQGVAFTSSGHTVANAQQIWQNIGGWLDFGGAIAIVAAIIQFIYAISPGFRNTIQTRMPGGAGAQPAAPAATPARQPADAPAAAAAQAAEAAAEPEIRNLIDVYRNIQLRP